MGPDLTSIDLTPDMVVVVMLSGVSSCRSKETGSDNSAGKLGDLNHSERRANIQN